MPFDPAPIQPAVEVGPYQADADAILRGCAITKPHVGAMCDDFANPTATCAFGAWYVGTGLPIKRFSDGDRADALCAAYYEEYGCSISDDNDYGKFTREQIAARIAALR